MSKGRFLRPALWPEEIVLAGAHAATGGMIARMVRGVPCGGRPYAGVDRYWHNAPGALVFATRTIGGWWQCRPTLRSIGGAPAVEECRLANGWTLFRFVWDKAAFEVTSREATESLRAVQLALRERRAEHRRMLRAPDDEFRAWIDRERSART